MLGYYLFFYIASSEGEPLPAATATESPSAFVDLRGMVLTGSIRGQPEVIELPSLERRAFDTGLRPRRVSGPNRDGYLLVLHEPHTASRRLRPWILHLDRPVRHDVGRSMKWAWSDACLAPRGTRVAVTDHSSGPKSQRWFTLTILDPVDPKFSREGPTCASSQIAWSPDGGTIYFTTRVSLDSLPAGTPPSYADTLRERSVEEGKVVCAFDLESGETREIVAGRKVLPSTTGRTLVVWRFWSDPVTFDLETKQESPLLMPDAHGGQVHALIDDRFVLYGALPREGLEARYARALAKAPVPMWSVKLATLETGEVWTVVPHVGRHTLISYGPP
jgi:hypothetical protein